MEIDTYNYFLLIIVLVTVSLVASLSVQSSVQHEGKARQDVKVEIKMTNLDLPNLYFLDIIKMFDSQNIVDQAVPLVVLVFVLIFKTLSAFEKGEILTCPVPQSKSLVRVKIWQRSKRSKVLTTIRNWIYLTF